MSARASSRKKRKDPPAAPVGGDDALAPALAWFRERGWTPHEFQLRAWQAYLEGRDGLVNAPTGSGKTLSVWIGPVLEALSTPAEPDGLKVLWITPLRALASDTLGALQAAAEGLEVDGRKIDWRIELRTGDTASSAKKRQREKPPHVLITTPESTALLLTYPEIVKQLGSLRAVIVDEWHELLSTKRGVQLELCLSRLRALAPGLRTWGLSATLGNLDQAMQVLVGPAAAAVGEREPTGPVLVRQSVARPIEVRTLIPRDIERFPWAGHLGLRLLPQVIEAMESAGTSLLFTNTRSQTEIWYQSIIKTRPDLIGQIALHHGSLDRDLRTWVENALRDGRVRGVVCTSSLDLGVDFAPVDQVIQIGSPKGVGRLLQRAGRSGHRPGAVSKLVCVPTNALELVEFAAAQDAMKTGAVESRYPVRMALDVLVQHLVAVAIGTGEAGVLPTELLAEARATHAFTGLTDTEFQWCMDFASRGGPALTAYPQYARIVPVLAEGVPVEPARFKIASDRLALLHRQSIGTILSDSSMTVRLGTGAGMGGGKVLGSIEEGFISRLTVGDTFSFAGRIVQLVKVREMTAWVQPAKRKSGRVPSWQGGRMPLSSLLAAAIRRRLDDAEQGHYAGPEMNAVAPLLRVQTKWSHLPRTGVLLIEHTTTREGHHVFVYPMEGRLVHEGLAALVAYRIAAGSPRSFSLAAGDHGFNLATPDALELDERAWRKLLSTDRLSEDLLACMNAAQLSRRQFREIARVAGLVVPGFPGAPKRTRHLQASSDLFFDVFREFDADNMLLAQSGREVLDRQLEIERMREALQRLATQRIEITRPERLTPFAFPLWADSLREQLSTEKWTDRVQRMLLRLETAAGGEAP